MRPWAPHPLLQSKRFHKISVFKWFSFQCFVSQCLWLSLCSVHRSPPNLVFFLFILTCLIPVVIWVCNSKLTPQPSPLTAVFIFMSSFPGLEHTHPWFYAVVVMLHTPFYISFLHLTPDHEYFSIMRDTSFMVTFLNEKLLIIYFQYC